jgi:hypothetical protein
MSANNIVVAIYNAHSEAEQAVRGLQRSGLDMKKLSIVARNPHTEEHVVGFYNTGDRIRQWGKAGAFWGGMWGGVLFGAAAFFALPGIGGVLVAGPLVAWMAGAVEGALVGGGISAVGAGLYSIGLPQDSILKYEVALETDRFLLMVHGTAEDTARAREIILATHPAELNTHPLRLADAAPAGAGNHDREELAAAR